jgi:carboxyl-terminal processing protease
VTSPSGALASITPNEALPPLYISAIQGGPAAQAGLEPGDVIESVNGSAPFVDGAASPGVFNLLDEQYPDEQPVHITLWRPATGHTWTVTLTPALFQPTAAATQMVTSQLLDGDVADVKLAQFGANAADDVLNAIAALAAGHTLHGIILDLRGNGGGDPTEVATLLGAFEHGEPWGYSCPLSGGCTASYPDATVSLLNLPLTVLTDRNCASACDAFSAAVKDLHLGTLIGTRTAGAASGQAQAFMLDDASLLELPAARWLGPDHEVINTVGVAPDYFIPLTAQDVSTGHDPDVAKALTLLNS